MKMRSQNFNRHSRRLRQGFSTFGAYQCDQRALNYQNRCFGFSNPRISKFQILTFFPFHFSLAHLYTVSVDLSGRFFNVCWDIK